MACGYDHLRSGSRVYYAKGDPDILLRKCTHYATPQGTRNPLDFAFVSVLQIKMQAMSSGGSVVLALAYSEHSLEQPPAGYTFLCLFRLDNPLKPTARTVVRSLRDFGIRNVILTGDRTETALKIAAETGVEETSSMFLTGKDIEKMSLAEVARQGAYLSVFTRLSPSQKGIIARMYQQRGHRVAVVGDGMNDVIALKAADVGISFFEQSSPLAKRSAQVLINDLPDILRVVETARRTPWQIGLVAACLTLLSLVLLLSGYLVG